MKKGKHTDNTSTRLTEAEWVIMQQVWEHEPCTAGTVQEALAADKGWAYSTVKTTMDRLVGKGALRQERLRNLQLFSAVVTRTEARKAEFRNMLGRAFDGGVGPMMQHLLEHEELSEADLESLESWIREQRVGN